jgi:hypothetical protein
MAVEHIEKLSAFVNARCSMADRGRNLLTVKFGLLRRDCADVLLAGYLWVNGPRPHASPMLRCKNISWAREHSSGPAAPLAMTFGFS